MDLLSVEECIKFKCIGGSCPISCCGGDWSIVVDDRSKEYYQSVKGEFGDRLRNGMEVIDGVTVFKLDENKDCVFLNDQKLCDIYREAGEDKLCETCKTYPRMYYQVGDMLFYFLANSCPEVTRLILQKNKPLTTLFDDSQNENEDALNEKDRQRFNHALRAFSAGMHILQNRDIVLRDRLVLLLLYISRYQEIIKQGQDPSNITGIFSQPEMYTLFLENNPVTGRDYITKVRAFKLVFGAMLDKSYSHPMWKKCRDLAVMISDKGIADIGILEKGYDRTDSIELQTELEQLMVYRFFAVFMQGFEKSDHLDKIAHEIVLYAALITYMSLTEIMQGNICTQEERIMFYSLCSRIGHSEKRRTELKKRIMVEGLYELGSLLKLVS